MSDREATLVVYPNFARSTPEQLLEWAMEILARVREQLSPQEAIYATAGVGVARDVLEELEERLYIFDNPEAIAERLHEDEQILRDIEEREHQRKKEGGEQ